MREKCLTLTQKRKEVYIKSEIGLALNVCLQDKFVVLFFCREEWLRFTEKKLLEREL